MRTPRTAGQRLTIALMTLCLTVCVALVNAAPAEAAVRAKRCESIPEYDKRICVRYVEKSDRHRASGFIDDTSTNGNPVDIIHIYLERYSCASKAWRVVRHKEGSHTYQSDSVALRTRRYEDFYNLVKWRARMEWGIQDSDGGISGELVTRAYGSC